MLLKLRSAVQMAFSIHTVLDFVQRSLTQISRDPWQFVRTVFVLALTWLAGTWNLSVLYALLVCGVFMYVEWVRKARRRRAAQLEFLKACHDADKVRALKTRVPPWVTFPDLEKARWLNHVLTALWPKVRVACEQSIRDSLTPLFEQYRPAFLTSLAFSTLSLGDIPPDILGVRVVDDSSLEASRSSTTTSTTSSASTLDDAAAEADADAEPGSPVSPSPASSATRQQQQQQQQQSQRQSSPRSFTSSSTTFDDVPSLPSPQSQSRSMSSSPTPDTFEPGADDTKHDSEREVVLDMEFQLAGNPDISLEAKAGLIGVEAKLAKLKIGGIIRLRLKPLIPQWPTFSAISVSFAKRPQIDFTLQAAKMNLMAIPGLNAWLLDFIKETIAYWIVWPKKIVVPLVNLPPSVMQALNDTTPKGMLRVVLLEAQSLQSSSDVYCTLRVTDAQKTSSKSKQRNNPRWDEHFEFMVSDPATQSLDIFVKMSGININHSQDELGECSIPISTLQPGVSIDRWVPLDVPQHLKIGGGDVHLALQWVPFQEDAQDDDTSSTFDIQQTDDEVTAAATAAAEASLRLRTPHSAAVGGAAGVAVAGMPLSAQTQIPSQAPPLAFASGSAKSQLQAQTSASTANGNGGMKIKAMPMEDKGGQSSAPPSTSTPMLESKRESKDSKDRDRDRRERERERKERERTWDSSEFAALTQTHQRQHSAAAQGQGSPTTEKKHNRSLTQSFTSLLPWHKKDKERDTAGSDLPSYESKTQSLTLPAASHSQGRARTGSSSSGGSTGSGSGSEKEMKFSKGALMVTVHSAKDVIAKDFPLGTSDPYVVISGCNTEVKTRVIQRTTNPTWSEDFQLPVSDTSGFVVFRVFDFDRVTEDEFLGEVSFRLDTIRRNPTLFAAKTDYPLTWSSAPGASGEAIDKTINRGHLTLSMRFVSLARTKTNIAAVISAAPSLPQLRHTSTVQMLMSARD